MNDQPPRGSAPDVEGNDPGTTTQRDGGTVREGDPAAGSPTYPSPLAAWSTVGILSIFYLVSLFDRNLIGLLIPDISADLGISDTEMGVLIGAAFSIFYSLGLLPIGWAIDRFNRRVVIWAGISVWSLGTMACGLGQGFAQLFAARSLVGAGEAVLMPGSQAILPETFPREKLSLPMLIYASFAKMGQGVSLIGGGWLILMIPPASVIVLAGLGELKGWQLIFVVAGAPGLLLAPLIFLLPKSTSRSRGVVSTYRDYFHFVISRWRFFVPHHLAALPVSLAVQGCTIWAPVFMHRVHGWEMSQVGLALGIALTIGPIAGMPLHGLIADRLFARGWSKIHLNYLALCLILAAPIGAAAFFVGNPILTIAILTLFYAVASGYIGLPIVILQILTPSPLRGKVAAVLLAFSNLLALGTGPIVIGGITEYLIGDPKMVGSSIALCLIIGLPLSALLYFVAARVAGDLLANDAAPLQSADNQPNGSGLTKSAVAT